MLTVIEYLIYFVKLSTMTFDRQPDQVPIGAAMAYGRSKTIDGLWAMIE